MIWLCFVGLAIAAPRDVPSGWNSGDAAAATAQSNAADWAAAWGGQVEFVMSTPDDDALVETLVIVDVPAPLPDGFTSDSSTAHAWLEPRAQKAFGTQLSLPATATSFEPTDRPDVGITRGRATIDDRVVLLAVAPKGARHVVVVMVLAANEEILYGDVFESTVDGLDGLSSTIAPFPRTTWRIVGWALWLVFGLGAAIEWTRRSLPRPGARVAGRQVAALLAATSILVLVVLGPSLGDSAVELTLAGTTPWSFAAELAAGGIVAAILAVVVTELWARRLTPVASAPRAGTFAPVATAPRAAESSASTLEVRNPALPPVPSIDVPSDDPALSTTSNTGAPLAPARPEPGAPDGPASLIDARESGPEPSYDDPTKPIVVGSIPKAIDPEEAPTPAPESTGASQSDLFPRLTVERGPQPTDSHPALDAPIPTYED
ncbi:MAG: hypothetical protein AAF799_44185 [Myxococcota bacterium]